MPLVVLVAIATGVCQSVWDRSEVKMGSILIRYHKIQLTFHSSFKLPKIIFLYCPDSEDRGRNFLRYIAGCHLSATNRVPGDLNTFGGPIPNAGVSDRPFSLVDICHVLGTVHLYKVVQI